MTSRPSSVVLRQTSRRALRSGLLWGAVFGGTIAASASGYTATFPTAVSRAKLAASFEGNAGIAAMLGAAHRLDTVAGFTAWRTMGVLSILGAVWGLFTATRLLRGEEDAGRWELLLAGPLSRAGAARQALAGLALGGLGLWAVTTAVAVAEGRAQSVRISAGGALYLATALATAPAMFLAIGAIVAQLAATRRVANAVGGAVLGGAYLVRMIADSTRDGQWLRWATPFGWVENLRPLTGSHSFALVPIGFFAIAVSGVSVVLAARRDVGAGMLPSPDRRAARNGLLNGALGLTVRLTRGAGIAWFVALGVSGLVFGLVAQSAARAVSGSSVITNILGRLGSPAAGARAYLGLTFLVAASLLTFMAAANVSSWRDEEATGRLDGLLARPVARTSWLLGRVGVAAAWLVVAGVATGAGAWAGAASQHTDVGFGAALGAGVNIVAPALIVLGIGMVVYGGWPRAAPTAAYLVVSWSLLVEIVGSAVTTNRWVLDSSILHHVSPAPAGPVDWTAVAILTLLAGLGVLAGTLDFHRRDLAPS